MFNYALVDYLGIEVMDFGIMIWNHQKKTHDIVLISLDLTATHLFSKEGGNVILSVTNIPTELGTFHSFTITNNYVLLLLLILLIICGLYLHRIFFSLQGDSQQPYH